MNHSGVKCQTPSVEMVAGQRLSAQNLLVTDEQRILRGEGVMHKRLDQTLRLQAPEQTHHRFIYLDTPSQSKEASLIDSFLCIICGPSIVTLGPAALGHSQASTSRSHFLS
jgi:hypothetical protein